MTDDALRDTVRAELESTLENGQFEPGGYLWEGPGKTIGADELALDVTTFSAALEGFGVGEVQCFVAEWLSDNAEKLRKASYV